MKRTHAIAIGLATVLMTTAAHAARPDREEAQAPRGQHDLQKNTNVERRHDG